MAKRRKKSESPVSAEGIVLNPSDHVERLKTNFVLKDAKHQAAIGPTFVGEERPYSVWGPECTRDKRLVLRAYWRARVGWGIGEKVKIRDVITRCSEEWGDGTLSFKDQKKILALIDELEQDGWIFKLHDRRAKPRTKDLGAKSPTSNHDGPCGSEVGDSAAAAEGTSSPGRTDHAGVLGQGDSSGDNFDRTGEIVEPDLNKADRPAGEPPRTPDAKQGQRRARGSSTSGATEAEASPSPERKNREPRKTRNVGRGGSLVTGQRYWWDPLGSDDGVATPIGSRTLRIN